ncbi:MAG: 4-hydroxy-3-methylbut-2-enyl diphosphate reductase [Chloroflexi bacterium]|nr:4-hydroxy-3-methylbut-2-enyl diphosphate reductase [Chloroflexota bacterium]
MPKAEVEKARALGFCFGVRRAIKIIEKAAADHRKIATLGPIVHNRLVVDRLGRMGIRAMSNLDQLKDETLAIASHGVPPQLLSQIEASNLNVIDTTCPTVRSAQKAARRLADAGFAVVIFGEATHPEVRGLLGWAGQKAIATLDAQGVTALGQVRKLGILSQTTQSRANFAEFVGKVTEAAFPHVHEIRVINTLCQETQKRQEAALELAGRGDLMIVVGGLNSANTQRLAEVCLPTVETHLIETADEIDPEWLKGKRLIGVTAGASTPDEAIEEVVERLKSLVSGLS